MFAKGLLFHTFTRMNNLKFSGHESFHCRPFWLKKGYDLVHSKKTFNDYAGIDMGVGRNMVGAIKFWLKAFELLSDKENLTELATKIFDDNGWDPFLEDEATLWLLHYKLSSSDHASIYKLIFSELRKTRPEFSKLHLINQVKELEVNQSENIVDKDFAVFVRTYLAKPSSDKEESYSGLLTDLGLLVEVGEDNQKNQLYHISNTNPQSLPWQVVLFCILENENYNDSISVKLMYSDPKGVGTIFALNHDQLEDKLLEISENVDDVVYKNDAGVKELQFKKSRPDGYKILDSYYER